MSFGVESKSKHAVTW